MNRNQLTRCLIMGGALALAGSLAAEPALLRIGAAPGETLVVDELILTSPLEDRYYRDLKMAMRFDGSWRVVSVQPQNLATIDSAAIHQDHETGVTLEVSGYTPNPCTSLQAPAIRRDGSTFLVMLAESAMDPLALCIQVLEPFELAIPLDTADLEAGDYRVRVNNTELQFHFEPPPPEDDVDELAAGAAVF